MRILLTTLNSKYVHSNLALKYLYSVAEGSDLDIELFEFTINNDRDYIYTEIVRGGYDYVCFSCYIWNIGKIKDLASDIKKACPEVKILLGGPEVSHETVPFMEENSGADYIIRGEGEYPFFQFCKELVLDENDFSKVSSLTYRENGQILETEDGPLLDMDTIPFPYESLPMEPDKVVYYESSRGCPYHCSYCLSSLEKNIRPLSVERTRRDLGYFLYKKVKQVKFIDRTFNYDKDRAYELWRYLIENDNGVTNFHFEICGELLDDRHFDLLSTARKGLFQFEIGIQSANPDALMAVDRKESVFPILHNVEKLLILGNIHIHVDLIAGLPHEDYKSFARSFNKVYELGADNLQLGFLKLLKGTKIRRQASEFGYVFRAKAPYEVISNQDLSAAELVKLKMIETVLDLYANKGGFEMTLEYILKSSGGNPFRFYEQLADFFFSKGYQHRSHKKEDLYRILLKFAESKGLGEGAEVFLTEDLSRTMNFDAVKKFHKKGWEI